MNTRYTILVKGRIPPTWANEFGPMTLDPRPDGTTALSGPVRDSCDLFGHLRKLHALGMELIAVQPGGRVPATAESVRLPEGHER